MIDPDAFAILALGIMFATPFALIGWLARKPKS